MSIRLPWALMLVFCATLRGAVAADAQPARTSAGAPAAMSRAVMTGEQVVQILDETVDWYRTLGVQQQSAVQPSDLLILYANRQTADKVIALAFEIARANAELLSSEAEVAQSPEAASGVGSPQALLRLRAQLDARRAAIQDEITALKREAPAQGALNNHAAKLAELQGELDLVNARRNLTETMSQFVYQSDANGSGASALKEHIDAIAASIPSSNSAAPGVAPAATSGSGGAVPASTAGSSGSLLNPAEEGGSRRLGIWDLAANVWRLAEKIRTIDTVDQHTAALQETFRQIRSRPLDQIKTLSARGDAIAQQADSADSAGLRGVRAEYDTLAWLFQQTSSILVPLSKAGVLLDQYRHNLSNWRDASQNQYHDALKALALRVGLLLALLLAVFIAAEIWRRAVFLYIHETRRRYQLLLVRKIVVGALVVAILGFTFATELSSLVTFAGLITAGLAVALQSVLVSIVGYFFLIGKYGIRLGDRVQIGAVTGEVIELGLVRLHLMELSGGQGPLGPTGRVVAFANSIVFQASGGIFKQIPGVNLAWHDITFSLPPGADPVALKEKLRAAADAIINDYREDIARQTQEIQRTASSSGVAGEAHPQVQLRFASSGVEALVRYPVQLQRAAEIDERVSQALLGVINRETAGPTSGYLAHEPGHPK